MSDEQINKCFIEIYNDILKYTNTCIRFAKLNFDANDLISESYIYINKLKDELESKEQLISYTKRYINISCVKSNTTFKNKYSVGKHSEMDCTEMFESKDFDIKLIAKELTDKFILTLNSYDKRLFNIYYTLGKTKGKEIAEYLDVHPNTGYSIRKEAIAVYERFKIFVKKYSENL